MKLYVYVFCNVNIIKIYDVLRFYILNLIEQVSNTKFNKKTNASLYPAKYFTVHVEDPIKVYTTSKKINQTEKTSLPFTT